MALTLQELRGVADRMRDGIVQCAKDHLFVRYRDRPEALPEKYREHARSLPPKLPIPKPIALASSPQDLRDPPPPAGRPRNRLRRRHTMRSKPVPPMTLKNMRENGVHAMMATCSDC